MTTNQCSEKAFFDSHRIDTAVPHESGKDRLIVGDSHLLRIVTL